jgi:uncharacterized membrane protein YphA (DoxX/SURF4 family)
MDIVLLIARILFAGMFIMSGINHLTKADAMTAVSYTHLTLPTKLL